VLLVDTDEPEPANRRKDRGARTDDDPRLTRSNALALVTALGLGQPGVDHGDEVAEPRPESPHGLWRQRDLGNEHDRVLAPLQRRRAGAQVDLSLPAARVATEKHVTAAPVDGRRDAP
jgi:hypothetical protein